MQPASPITSKQYFRVLSTVHLAFITGQVLFAAVTVVLITSGSFSADVGDLEEVLPVVAIIIAAAGVIAGHLLFIKKREALRRHNSLSQKLRDYRTALLTRWALLEGPFLFAVIAFLLTGKYWLLGLCAALIALFISYKPSREKAQQDLQLPHDEEYLLSDPEAVVE